MNDRTCRRSCWELSPLQWMIHDTVHWGWHPVMGAVRIVSMDDLVPGALSSFPLMGVVIALIDCPWIIPLSEHFTYPNDILFAVGHRGSDKRGSKVVIFPLYVIKLKGSTKTQVTAITTCIIWAVPNHFTQARKHESFQMILGEKKFLRKTSFQVRAGPV